MAFASSVIGAQEAIIKPCDLCEDDEDVNWFCKDCVQNLCERCKKMHLKIVTCEHHQVVSTLEGLIIMKRNVSNVCKLHDMPFSFFCRSCDKNICSKCLSMKHKKHDVIDIAELQSDLHRKLDKVLKEKVREQEKITSNIYEYEQYEKYCEETRIQNDADLDEKVKYICKAANDLAENMKKVMKQISGQRMAETKESKQKLEVNRTVYEEEIRNIQQEMKFQTAETLNQFVKTSISNLQHLKPLTISIPEKASAITAGIFYQTFIQSLTYRAAIKDDKSRKLRKNKVQKKDVCQKLKIVKSISLGNETEWISLCIGPDGTIWLVAMKDLYIITPDDIAERIWDLNFITTRHIACLHSGEIVVCPSNITQTYDRDVDKFSTAKCSEGFIRTKGFTHGILVNDSDEIVVGCSKHSEEAKISSIEIISNEGEQLKENNVRNAHRFCINNESNVLTSDGNFLTLYDKSGSVLKKTKRMKSYKQRMICDRYGNIIGIGDNEKEIHLISEDGQVEQTFYVDCKQRVSGICVDKNNDRLLILVDENKVIFANYLN